MQYKVEIKPIAKSRPRVTSRGTFMPTVYTMYKEQLRALLLAQGFRFDDSRYVLDVEFYFKVPKSIKKSEREKRLKDQIHLQKPDLDNLVGGVMDALYPENDSQIAKVRAVKYWSEDFEGIVLHY